ncbi:hypothetical protein AB0K80_03630 [Streptomyces sp. NPDC052682]|uniref:hypothetical protein n=1 Tax=Streptomyces sp. NPDC052682 TaxID=3154954 RepID=UPI00341B6781
MQSRGHVLKLTAVSALVVLALTGFSTGRHHGGGHGGGCSSSQQDHDSSSSSGGGGAYKEDDDHDAGYDAGYGGGYGGGYGTGSGGSGTGEPGDGSGSVSAGRLEPATVRLLKCATVKEPYATVEVTNPNGVDAAFWVAVSFRDAKNGTLKDETWRVDVPAGDKLTVDVEMSNRSMASSVDHCVVEPQAEPDN